MSKLRPVQYYRIRNSWGDAVQICQSNARETEDCRSLIATSRGKTKMAILIANSQYNMQRMMDSQYK
eukprot:scaffold6733_cov77-Cyclotella_meneghiniana.AAC.7